MITLRQIAGQIHRILNGGQANTDSEYDDRYTISLIRSSMNSLLLLKPTQKQYEGDRTLNKMYIATYPGIVVKNDDTTERSYAELPDFYISLSFDRGVVQVSAMDKPLEPMIPKRNPSVSNSLPCGELQGRKGYYVEGLRIYWDELINKKAVQKVLVKLLVAAPDSIGMNDILPITPDQIVQVRQMVIAEYRQEGVQDKIVDSNKDLGVRISKQQ